MTDLKSTSSTKTRQVIGQIEETKLANELIDKAAQVTFLLFCGF